MDDSWPRYGGRASHLQRSTVLAVDEAEEEAKASNQQNYPKALLLGTINPAGVLTPTSSLGFLFPMLLGFRPASRGARCDVLLFPTPLAARNPVYRMQQDLK
ncbi:hypothetical protein JZ751_011142 [Albula glossodonta]|uniref:Uncharacterized protein n=1 Tax=Albula glossodonta TaxID=121402 RepID=A0A8T2P4C3_9TELE|nr:hypothetical protein JZ751_011142 [Albula glossodonta]